ncbi:MAG: ATP synthase F1 subunit gamma [Clostridia bacterium]|nr:ATP synthase F1 subunit gamma [Clostridia bacterium]
MGADIKSLRTRIKSVSSTLHLTKAMGLVASSKMRRANDASDKSRTYKNAFRNIINVLSLSKECEKSPYMAQNSTNKHKIIIIAGDRGLAGGYNANVFRLASQYSGAEFIPIGKRACERFKCEIVESEDFPYQKANELAGRLCNEFVNGEFDKLSIISTEYVSMMTQNAVITDVLPIKRAENLNFGGASVEFEPDEKTVLDICAKEYVAALIMWAVKESFASEVAARRMAMDSAGKNAQEMIDSLQLDYNRARQSAITQEITEIVAGSGE